MIKTSKLFLFLLITGVFLLIIGHLQWKYHSNPNVKVELSMAQTGAVGGKGPTRNAAESPKQLESVHGKSKVILAEDFKNKQTSGSRPGLKMVPKKFVDSKIKNLELKRRSMVDQQKEKENELNTGREEKGHEDLHSTNKEMAPQKGKPMKKIENISNKGTEDIQNLETADIKNKGTENIQNKRTADIKNKRIEDIKNKETVNNLYEPQNMKIRSSLKKKGTEDQLSNNAANNLKMKDVKKSKVSRNTKKNSAGQTRDVNKEPGQHVMMEVQQKHAQNHAIKDIANHPIKQRITKIPTQTQRKYKQVNDVKKSPREPKLNKPVGEKKYLKVTLPDTRDAQRKHPRDPTVKDVPDIRDAQRKHPRDPTVKDVPDTRDAQRKHSRDPTVKDVPDTSYTQRKHPRDPTVKDVPDTRYTQRKHPRDPTVKDVPVRQIKKTQDSRIAPSAQDHHAMQSRQKSPQSNMQHEISSLKRVLLNRRQ